MTVSTTILKTKSRAPSTSAGNWKKNHAMTNSKSAPTLSPPTPNARKNARRRRKRKLSRKRKRAKRKRKKRGKRKKKKMPRKKTIP